MLEQHFNDLLVFLLWALIHELSNSAQDELTSLLLQLAVFDHHRFEEQLYTVEKV